MDTLLGILFIVICVLLIVIVLLQKGRGGGLGAAFGGAGSSAFGTKTGDVFTWITIVLTGLFLLMAIGTGLAYRPDTAEVLNPECSHKAGPISEPTLVILKCETTGAKIAYTTDGSDPDVKKAAAGAVQVTVMPGQTLRAQAFRTKWEPSEIVELKFPKAAPATMPTTVPAAAPSSVPATMPN